MEETVRSQIFLTSAHFYCVQLSCFKGSPESSSRLCPYLCLPSGHISELRELSPAAPSTRRIVLVITDRND